MADYDYSGYFEPGTSLNDRQFMQLMDNRWRMIYPAPFFDPIAMQTVADPKLLIMWSRFFYDWHPLIHAAINKMVTYPITDFIYDTKDEKVRSNYEAVFKKLNVRGLMVRAGLDYFVCGNAFISFVMPFKRMFTCSKCGYGVSASAAKFKPSAKQINMVCPNCNEVVTPKIDDIITEEIERLRAILWNPMNMQLEYDEIIDDTEYYYGLPNKIKDGIIKGERKYLEKYPLYFIQAAHEKKMIRIFNNKIIHVKRDTHSASYHKGFGQPLVTPVLKQLFHLMLLMRAQDALAIDQILPWNILSPSANAGVDPAGDMDLNNWQDQVKREYEEWKKNPLRKSFMPIPINAQMIGGQGKALMLTPEMDAISNQILAGMGVPQEFIFGGLQWSGANVSLRMLENQFINYRIMMQRVIDWIVEQISDYFGYPAINIKMQEFKMADDIQQKQMIIALAQNQIISNQTLLSEIMPEADYTQEQERIEKEQIDKIKQQTDIQRSQGTGGLIDPSVGVGQTGQQGGQQGGAVAQKNNPESRPPRGKNAQI